MCFPAATDWPEMLCSLATSTDWLYVRSFGALVKD